MEPQLYYFVANRDMIVSSTLGYRIGFEKGKPQHVPRLMHPLVLEKGVQPCTKEGKILDKPEVAVAEAPKVRVAPEDAAERTEAIIEVMKQIIARNESTDFTSGGSPSAAAITMTLGWRVDPKEVRSVWEKNRHELLTGKKPQE